MNGVVINGPGSSLTTQITGTQQPNEQQGASSTVTADMQVVAAEKARAEYAASLPQGITPEMVELLKSNGFSVEKAPAQGAAPASTKAETPVAFDVTPFQEEFRKTGDLVPESREKLKSQFKIDDSALDLYLEGVRSNQEKAKALTLGKANLTSEEFDTMAAWSQANETPEKVAERNAALADKNPEVVKGALLSLQNDYIMGMNATVDPILTRHGGGTVGTTAITNQAQLQAAISDERYYRKDAVGEAYRNLVQSRIRF